MRGGPLTLPPALAEIAAGDPGPRAGQGHGIPPLPAPAGGAPGKQSIQLLPLYLPLPLPPSTSPLLPLPQLSPLTASLCPSPPCSGLRAAGRHLPRFPGAHPGRVGPQETPSGSPAGQHPGPGEPGSVFLIPGMPALQPLREELTLAHPLPLASPGEEPDEGLH